MPGHAVADAAGGGDAVDVAHADVHDHDGRAAALGEHDGGLAVAGLADDADVRLARERHAQTLANDLVVVGDQAGDRLVCVHGHGSGTPRAGVGAALRFPYRQPAGNR